MGKSGVAADLVLYNSFDNGGTGLTLAVGEGGPPRLLPTNYSPFERLCFFFISIPDTPHICAYVCFYVCTNSQ